MPILGLVGLLVLVGIVIACIIYVIRNPIKTARGWAAFVGSLLLVVSSFLFSAASGALERSTGSTTNLTTTRGDRANARPDRRPRLLSRMQDVVLRFGPPVLSVGGVIGLSLHRRRSCGFAPAGNSSCTAAAMFARPAATTRAGHSGCSFNRPSRFVTCPCR